jgi:hypothetical protein
MPRPLKIYKNITREDQNFVHDSAEALLDDTIVLSHELLELFAVCCRVLIEKDKATTADICIVDLAVRLWNDIRSANILTKRGLYLQVMMLERDSIETLVVAEYLHSNPQYADEWRKAQSLKERRRFGINELQSEVEDGKEWKGVWDWLSSYIHPNCLAAPVYGANKQYYGHNIYLDGFYQPGPMCSSWHIQLSLTLHFTKNLWNWYKDELPFPPEMQSELLRIEENYREQTEKLKARGHSQQKEMTEKIEQTRLSDGEIIELFRFLDGLE